MVIGAFQYPSTIQFNRFTIDAGTVVATLLDSETEMVAPNIAVAIWVVTELDVEVDKTVVVVPGKEGADLTEAAAI
jgi:hypothetical protein